MCGVCVFTLSIINHKSGVLTGSFPFLLIFDEFFVEMYLKSRHQICYKMIFVCKKLYLMDFTP